MHVNRFLPALTLGGTLLSAIAMAQADTHAAEAIKEGVQASGHASASAAHSIVASGQVTSATAAVPLSVGAVALGSAGVASGRAANGSAQSAAAPIGTPLPVTDETIVTVSPDVALKKKDATAGTEPAAK